MSRIRTSKYSVYKFIQQYTTEKKNKIQNRNNFMQTSIDGSKVSGGQETFS